MLDLIQDYLINVIKYFVLLRRYILHVLYVPSQDNQLKKPVPSYYLLKSRKPEKLIILWANLIHNSFQKQPSLLRKINYSSLTHLFICCNFAFNFHSICLHQWNMALYIQKYELYQTWSYFILIVLTQNELIWFPNDVNYFRLFVLSLAYRASCNIFSRN